MDDDFDSGKGEDDAGAINTGVLPTVDGGDDTRPVDVIVPVASVSEAEGAPEAADALLVLVSLRESAEAASAIVSRFALPLLPPFA